MAARRVTLIFLTLLLGAWPFMAAAQVATPGKSSSTPLDLAAIALTPNDVPADYFDDYSEWWVPHAQFSDLVLDGAAVPPGLQRVYQTFYAKRNETAALHNYLYEFASPQEAAAGFEIIDAALRPPLPDGSVIGPTHSPGPDLGDQPGMTTFVTYDTWIAGGPRVDIVATSFRRDRLVAGVAVEQYTDPPPSSSPVADAATPIGSNPAQEQLATSLATRLDERITTVLAGRVPAGVELALSNIVLPLDQLVDVPTPVLGGYKAGIDLLRCGICNEENSLLRFADAALGGFTRGIALGPVVDGEPQPPFVSVAISTFTSPDAALEVLAAIRKAPNDRPTPGPIPRGRRTLAADPTIPETTAAIAFHAAMDAENPNAPLDSAGVDFVAGTRLVTVDVQGGLSAEEAMVAAIDLATQQSACLASSDPCVSVMLPPSLPADPSGP